MLNNPLKKIFIISGIVLLIDQTSKILVKTNMYLGQEIYIFDWFRIFFIENPGMAFGLAIPGIYGKLLLMTFRLCIVAYGLYYIRSLVKKNDLPIGLLISFGLILGGAIGNIIDGVFYGLIFGYDKLFYGRVVDMLSFPFFTTDLPNWLSFLEGSDGNFTFFAPIFNIADSAIFIGLFSLLLFYRKQFQ